MGDPAGADLQGKWTVIPLNDKNEQESPPPEKPLEYCCTCCCCKFIAKDEVFAARRDLYGIIFDWLIDFFVGTMHILRNQLIGGILTFLIVIHAGIIITFTNFSHQVSRSVGTRRISIRKELRRSHKIYTGLSYIPSFFPICSAKLRLVYAKRLKKCKEPMEKECLKESMNFVKDKALFDSCCETFFEGFPQAVLQIVLLSSKSYRSLNGFPNFLRHIIDYLPIITIFTAMYGITNSPISVMEFRYPQKVLKFGEKVTAYASNSVRVFSCALFIMTIQEAVSTFIEETSAWLNIFCFGMSTLIIFCLLGGPFILKYEIDKTFIGWEKMTMNGINALSLLTSIGGFGCWASLEVFQNGWNSPKFIIISSCFTFLVILYCFGIILYSETLDLYQSTAADVIVQAYLALKRSGARLLHILLCRRAFDESETKTVSVNQ